MQLRRGLESNRTSKVFKEGEPVYVTDTKKVYIGDGSTAGGVDVGSGGANIKKMRIFAIDQFDFTPGAAYAAGDDGNLDFPSNAYETAANFVPMQAENLIILNIGLLTWSYIGNPIYWTGESPVSTSYGSISFISTGFNWNTFGTGDGLKTFTLPKSANGDTLGGYFTYYYLKAAWESAFSGNAANVIIDQSGSVYKGSISKANLVVSFDGTRGPAGGFVLPKPANATLLHFTVVGGGGNGGDGATYGYAGGGGGGTGEVRTGIMPWAADLTATVGAASENSTITDGTTTITATAGADGTNASTSTGGNGGNSGGTGGGGGGGGGGSAGAGGNGGSWLTAGTNGANGTGTGGTGGSVVGLGGNQTYSGGAGGGAETGGGGGGGAAGYGGDGGDGGTSDTKTAQDGKGYGAGGGGGGGAGGSGTGGTGGAGLVIIEWTE